MTDKMIEFKKDSLRQMQSGDIKLGFTIQHNDMPDYLFSDPMGKRYYVVFFDADHYDETEGQSSCPEIPDSSVSANNAQVQNEKQPSINEKSEGDRIRVRAVMLCKEREFWDFIFDLPSSFPTSRSLDEESAVNALYHICRIKSRSELTTNEEAQRLFKQLDQKYKDWQFKQRYAENISKM